MRATHRVPVVGTGPHDPDDSIGFGVLAGGGATLDNTASRGVVWQPTASATAIRRMTEGHRGRAAVPTSGDRLDPCYRQRDMNVSQSTRCTIRGYSWRG